MVDYILQEPAWLLVWVFWMGTINSLAIVFLKHRPACWILAAFLGNLLFMTTLFEVNGYNRLLGLSHVIFWTPLLVYLFRIRNKLPRAGLIVVWIKVLFLTNALSLMVDYSDVARYLLGERS